MRLTILSAVLVPFTLFTIACGGDDDGGPSLGGAVVGSWRELPNATDDDPPPPIADRTVFTFNADGTMMLVSPDETETGTYVIEGGDLVLTSADTGGPQHVSTIPYRATAEHFVFGAFLPAAGVDGMVGTWTATIVSDAQARTVTLTLRADATATYANDNADAARPDETYDGTWRAVGDDVEIVLMPQPNFTIHLRARLSGGVMGTVYERLP